MAQRLGRIVRQGNRNAVVDIYRYVTENTFDAYLYQLVENKQKFIAQIMTSKTPLRAAEDVDETALSYSEIKALATGNPLIIEKCDLDIQVGKLNMLKANYLNQRYALEELVYRKYPSEIVCIKEKIEGLKKDIELADSYPKPQQGFCGMVILDKKVVDKEQAGKAILNACSRIVDSDSVQLGQYRGFIMTLVFNVSNGYYIALKGTLSHNVTLGTDLFGNITRIDNTLSNLPNILETACEELSNIEKQLKNARIELEAPFVKEAELTEKTARLKELNILLNLNSGDRKIVDTVPNELANKEKRRPEYVR